MITKINEFKKIFESPRKTGSVHAVERIDTKSIASEIAHKLFPGYTEGRYDHKTTYNYGGTVKWVDGSEERGYTTDDYTLDITGEWLVLNSCKFDEKEKKKFFTIIDKTRPHKDNVLDSVKIRVRRADGITSKKSELYDIKIWAGDSDRGASSYASIIGNEFDDKYINRLKIQLNSWAKIKSKELLSTIFGNFIYMKNMIKSTTTEQSSTTRHQGYGSQASDKVSHKILKSYDFREFIKKYSEQELINAMNSSVAKYFKEKFYKGLQDGMMQSDESWTDTYD